MKDKDTRLMERLTEIRVADIWSDAFGRRIKDYNADFISIGGTSLLAAHIAAEISSQSGKKISLVDVIVSSSIRQLVHRINGEG